MRTDDEALAELQELAEADCQRLEAILMTLEPERLELAEALETVRVKDEAILSENGFTDDH